MKKLCVGSVLVLVVIFSFQTTVNGQWPAGMPKPDSSIPDPPHAWVDVSGDGTIANPWAIVYSDTEVLFGPGKGTAKDPTFEIGYRILRGKTTAFTPNVSELTHEQCAWIRTEARLTGALPGLFLKKAEGKTSRKTSVVGYIADGSPNGRPNGSRTDFFREFIVETQIDDLMLESVKIVPQDELEFNGSVSQGDFIIGSATISALQSSLPTIQQANRPTYRRKGILQLRLTQDKWFLGRRLLGVNGDTIVIDQEEKPWIRPIPGSNEWEYNLECRELLVNVAGVLVSVNPDNRPALPSNFGVPQFWSTNIYDFVEGFYSWLPHQWAIDNRLPWDGYL